MFGIVWADILPDKDAIADFGKTAKMAELKLEAPKSIGGFFSLQIIPADKSLKELEINRFVFLDHGAVFALKGNTGVKDKYITYNLYISDLPEPKYETYPLQSGKIVMDLDYATYCIWNCFINKKIDLTQYKTVSFCIDVRRLLKGSDKEVVLMSNSVEIDADKVIEMLADFKQKAIKVEDPWLKYMREQVEIMQQKKE